LILICVALVFLAIFLWHRSIHSKLFSAIVALSVFSALFLLGLYYIANYLTGSGIDESVFYHLTADMEGAAYIEFSGLIVFSLIYFVAISAVSMVTYKSVRTEYKISKNKYRFSAALLAITMAFYLNPAVSDISLLLYKSGMKSSRSIAVPDLYIKNKAINFDGKPKNIVYLYLESVERTYLDENLFPGLMPNLKVLENKSLSFTDIREVGGTNWTVASMTASQCGLPLVAPGGGNSMSGMDEFLPGALCIGDVLDNKGYNLNYLGGADLDFAGKGKFYATHGFDKIEGLDELVDTLEAPAYKSSWGLYDDSLYSIARRRFDELSSKNGPFGLFLLTLDTHHPHGHIAKSCKNIVYEDGNNPMLNAVHCADKMAADFVNYIMESDAFKDTILVVSSDHLAMRNNAAWKKLQAGERRNLLMFFGEGISPRRIAKPGSSLDIAPTALNMLGADIDGFGFGRDLMRESPGPGLDKTLLRQSRSYLSSLWSFPQLDRGFRVDLMNNKLFLADRYIRFPALFILDEDLNVTEIHFQFESSFFLYQQIARLSYDQRFLWVDSCTKNAALSSELPLLQGQYCAVYGALGSKDINLIALAENLEIEFSELVGMLDKAKFSKEFYKQRLSTLDRINRFNQPVQRQLKYLPRVAHAGGGYNGATYTNSIDALNHNKDDYELFEIDFSWTSDGHLVCLHDWGNSFKRSFGLEPQGKVTKSVFEELVRTKARVKNCTLSTLVDWLKKNDKARIVTDVKEMNVEALHEIARIYPDLQDRFVPQVYTPSEYLVARELGYDDVIWTLYNFKGRDNVVLGWLKSMDLYGLTMPISRAERGLGKRAKDKTGVLSWVHTINSQKQYNKLSKSGIASIYTDRLPCTNMFSKFWIRFRR